MGRVRRLAGNGSSRQDVRLGLPPVRVIEQIERFHAELKLVMFVVGHADVFVYFGRDRDFLQRRAKSEVAAAAGSI